MKLEDIIKKIYEDPSQEVYKNKMKAHIQHYEGLPLIENEPAQDGNITTAELEQMDDEYHTLLKTGHNNKQVQDNITKKVKMLNISITLSNNTCKNMTPGDANQIAVIC